MTHMTHTVGYRKLSDPETLLSITFDCPHIAERCARDLWGNDNLYDVTINEELYREGSFQSFIESLLLIDEEYRREREKRGLL